MLEYVDPAELPSVGEMLAGRPLRYGPGVTYEPGQAGAVTFDNAITRFSDVDERGYVRCVDWQKKAGAWRMVTVGYRASRVEELAPAPLEVTDGALVDPAVVDLLDAAWARFLELHSN